MFSNLPVTLQQQDFQARHSDMLAAARSETIYDPKAPKRRTMGEVINEAMRRWRECAQQSSDFNKMLSSAPPAKVGATLRIRMPSDYAVTDGPFGADKVRAAEKILADHQKLMAENVRLRKQQQNMRPGLSRAEFQALVSEACASPTPPPSSQG